MLAFRPDLNTILGAEPHVLRQPGSKMTWLNSFLIDKKLSMLPLTFEFESAPLQLSLAMGLVVFVDLTFVDSLALDIPQNLVVLSRSCHYFDV